MNVDHVRGGSVVVISNHVTSVKSGRSLATRALRQSPEEPEGSELTIHVQYN
jgi:hypothetical protein